MKKQLLLMFVLASIARLESVPGPRGLGASHRRGVATSVRKNLSVSTNLDAKTKERVEKFKSDLKGLRDSFDKARKSGSLNDFQSALAELEGKISEASNEKAFFDATQSSLYNMINTGVGSIMHTLKLSRDRSGVADKKAYQLVGAFLDRMVLADNAPLKKYDRQGRGFKSKVILAENSMGNDSKSSSRTKRENRRR